MACEERAVVGTSRSIIGNNSHSEREKNDERARGIKDHVDVIVLFHDLIAPHHERRGTETFLFYLQSKQKKCWGLCLSSEVHSAIVLENEVRSAHLTPFSTSRILADCRRRPRLKLAEGFFCKALLVGGKLFWGRGLVQD